MAKTDINYEFKKISQELFDKSPLSYFALSISNLTRNTVSFISTHPAFTIDMFDSDFPFMAPLLDEGFYSVEGIFKDMPEQYAQNNLANIFFVIKHFEENIYCYTFGSDLDKPPLINFYINNLDYLEKFTLYFQEQGKGIIQSIKSDSHTIPHHVNADLYKDLLHDKIKEEPIIIQKFFNSARQDWIKLSERERETLLYAVIHGKTAAQTGEILNISPKTVESHLESLRKKLGAKTKGELLQRAIDMSLIRLQSYF